jgi:uncharacterized membrane protein YphA (DoxX/SURF4 family)
MNIVIWVIQGILAIMFIISGVMKTTQPKEKLVQKLPWVKDFSIQTVRFIGISELLGAIGVIIPYLTGIYPILTPIAAIGISIIMISASIYHYGKKEYKEIAFNFVLFALAIITAYSRL